MDNLTRKAVNEAIRNRTVKIEVVAEAMTQIVLKETLTDRRKALTDRRKDSAKRVEWVLNKLLEGKR